MTDPTQKLTRIADALERIATALEKQQPHMAPVKEAPLGVGTRIIGRLGTGVVTQVGVTGVTVMWDKGGPETMTMEMARRLGKLKLV